MSHKTKNDYIYYLCLCLIILVGIVYAVLQANLQINGTAKIGANTWDIHFDNVDINENSVPIGTGDSAATIDPTNNCKVDFIVTLSLPGDFYEFTVDVVNAGTIDGMIETYTLSDVPDYLTYSVTYSDGVELAQYQLLSAGSTETYKVKLEFKNDIEELPEGETLTTSFEVEYVQADTSGIPVRVVPEADFATDSWADIIAAYNAGVTTNLQSAMESGTTREIQLDLDLDGTPETTRHLRIANLSKPAECTTTGFSQTACGFVLEFADIITTHQMNPYSNGSTNGDGNKGGWEYSEMRTYINSDIYNALPIALKNAIINTTVVSGHGSNDTANFTTTDKLYLLSPHEVWEDVDGDISNGIDYYDTAYSNTRQLDYYAGLNVTTSSYAEAIKKNNSLNTFWWLRSAYFNPYNIFFGVFGDGSFSGSSSYNTYGVSPAFRIAT